MFMDCILLTASSGGHLAEISNLDLLGESYEVILLTEKTDCNISTWYAINDKMKNTITEN